MLRETIYLDTDNTIVLGLLIDGVEYAADQLSRIVIKLQDDDGNTPITIDSDISTGAFKFDEKAAVLDQVITVVVLELGGESIPARDDYIATFTLYSPSWTNGIVWDDKLAISVVDP